MVWNEIKQCFRAITSPIVHLLSGFDVEVTANYVRGSDDPYKTNGSSKYLNKLGQLMDGGFFDKALASLKKSGDDDGIEKVAELKKNREENIKDWLERIKGSSLAEKKQIMDEIVSQTKSEQDAINQILGDNNRKLEQRNLKTLEEAEEARQRGDNKKYAEYCALIEQQQKEIHQGNLLKEHINKKKKEGEKLAKEFAEEVKKNQTWYSDINWGSWQVWLVVISALGFLYLIYRGIKWIYYKYLAN